MASDRGTPDPWLAVVRIALGLWFLKAAFEKLDVVWAFGYVPLPGASERFQVVLATRVAEWVATPEVAGWYRGFLHSVVLPNAATVAHLQAIGETAVGLGLLLGLFTPASAAVGLFLTLNYALVTIHLGFCQQGFHFLLVACLVAVLFGQAGRRLGIDGWRKGPRPAVTLA
ncbi:MAG TPA: TQO small subunit DoxD [Thermodesulfobacteriota bacterium]